MTRFLLSLLAASFIHTSALAQSPFDGGWRLNAEKSVLHFTSVKKGNVSETSHFDTIDGAIDANGLAQMTVQLESLDTGIDIRNVRMRFLFFETFAHPTANITAQLRQEDVAGLSAGDSRHLILPLSLDLHGIAAEVDAHVSVSVLSPGEIAVHTTQPVKVTTDMFELNDGLAKLEEAANAKIMPLALVHTTLHFQRPHPKPIAAVQPAAAPQPRRTQSNDSSCASTITNISAQVDISFDQGGTRLTPQAQSNLNQLVEALFSCPVAMLEIAGHTDSQGSAAANKALSRRRAERVAAYLYARGIPEPRLAAIGYGEAFPVVPNNSAENQARNRRIVFRVLN